MLMITKPGLRPLRTQNRHQDFVVKATLPKAGFPHYALLLKTCPLIGFFARHGRNREALRL
jgi:hypothetical protein